MSKTERIRQSWSGPITADLLSQRAETGWKLVAIEWEREIEPSSHRYEPPYGLAVADDCVNLKENPAEMAALQAMMDLIAQDMRLSQVAVEMNQRGLRTRRGEMWTPVAVFEMLPRLIDAGPRILSGMRR